MNDSIGDDSQATPGHALCSSCGKPLKDEACGMTHLMLCAELYPKVATEIYEVRGIFDMSGATLGPERVHIVKYASGKEEHVPYVETEYDALVRERDEIVRRRNARAYNMQQMFPPVATEHTDEEIARAISGHAKTESIAERALRILDTLPADEREHVFAVLCAASIALRALGDVLPGNQKMCDQITDALDKLGIN